MLLCRSKQLRFGRKVLLTEIGFVWKVTNSFAARWKRTPFREFVAQRVRYRSGNRKNPDKVGKETTLYGSIIPILSRTIKVSM